MYKNPRKVSLMDILSAAIQKVAAFLCFVVAYFFFWTAKFFVSVGSFWRGFATIIINCVMCSVQRILMFYL